VARKATWIDTLIAFSVASGAQQVISLMGGLLPIETRGYTLTRTILELSMVPPTAVSDGFQAVSLGVQLVSQEGFNAGVVPDPNVGADRPPRGWVYRTRRAVAGAASMVSHDPLLIMADIRAKRRVDDGELVLTINNDAIDGTAFSVRLDGIVRCAYLLP